MRFLLEGMDEKLGRVGNVAFCVQIFVQIQDAVVSTSEYLGGNEVLYDCTSLSHKCQNEFSQLEKIGYGKVPVPWGLYSSNDTFVLQVSDPDEFSSWSFGQKKPTFTWRCLWSFELVASQTKAY